MEKRISLSLLAWSVVLVTAGFVFAAPRKWTDNTGRFSTEAEFVDFKDGKVQLKRDDSTITIDFERLSAADQAWVKSRVAATDELTSQGQAVEKPRSPREQKAVAKSLLGPELLRTAEVTVVVRDASGRAAADQSEDTPCMSCQATIPADSDTCPNCGWSFNASETDTT